MKRLVLASIAFGVIAAGVCAWAIGSQAISPAPAEIPESALSLPHEQVVIPSASGSQLHGWYIPGSGKHGTVVLMHGIRSNRLSMIPRARFLNEAGFSVLLFDFQAHGQSPGKHITFGHLEAMDAQAAVAFVRSRHPSEPIFAIGTSLGGAAALLGEEALRVQALVLEAVYPRMSAAASNRLAIRFGPAGRLLTAPLLIQLFPRLGVSPSELAPIDGMRRATAPVLVIAGADDQRTTPNDSKELYEAAPDPKAFWLIDGAAHVDMHRFNPIEYETRVMEFFSKYRDTDLNQF